MTEEPTRTRRRAIGPRLKYYDEVTGLCICHFHAVGQKVERRAQGTHDRGNASGSTGDMIPDADGIILADDLAEISRRREMMVQPAVGDQEHLAARDLAIDHSAHIN